MSAVARTTSRGDGFVEGGVRALLVPARDPRERQHPERVVSPRTSRGLQICRPDGVRQHVARAVAAHDGPQHRPPGLERGGAVRRPALERSALGNVGEMLDRGEVAQSDLLPGRQDGEPRTLQERVVVEPPQPPLHRGASAGPVIAEHPPADGGGDEVEVASGERMLNREVEGAGLRVPDRGPPMQPGNPPGLARRELALEEVAQEGVVAIRPPVLVHEEGRTGEPRQELGRPVPLRHEVAERSGEPFEDRRARQEGHLLVGPALEELGSEVVGNVEVAAGNDMPVAVL